MKTFIPNLCTYKIPLFPSDTDHVVGFFLAIHQGQTLAFLIAVNSDFSAHFKFKSLNCFIP
jgi:hypothetical protein